jgi:hypothetical protein
MPDEQSQLHAPRASTSGAAASPPQTTPNPDKTGHETSASSQPEALNQHSGQLVNGKHPQDIERIFGEPQATSYLVSDTAAHRDVSTPSDQPQLDASTFNLPPPPPPPLNTQTDLPNPPPPYVFANDNGLSHIPVAHRRVFVDRLDHEQEQIRDLRDDVLGSRFRLAAKRKALRDLHIEASAKDGSVFNLFRHFLYEYGSELPDDIEDALKDASSLRDQLGLLEVEYDEAEANYNTLEWLYTRKESKFVEELIDKHKTPGHSVEVLQTAALTAFADDVSIMNPETDFDDAINEATVQAVVLSEQALLEFDQAATSAGDGSRTHTDKHEGRNGLLDTQSAWINKLKRIEDWLQSILEGSPVQKTHLKALVDCEDLNDASWQHEAEQNWTLEYSRLPVFHTGDSTVSQNNASASQHVSTSTVDLVGSETSALKAASVSSKPPGDCPVEHSEPAIKPAGKESGDLSGATLQGQNSHQPPLSVIEENTNSISTTQPLSQSTSAGGETTTDTTSHAALSPSHHIDRVLPSPLFNVEHFTERLPPSNQTELEISSAPPTPMQLAQVSPDVTTPGISLDLEGILPGASKTEAGSAATMEHTEAPQTSRNSTCEQRDSPLYHPRVQDSELSQRQPSTAHQSPAEPSSITSLGADRPPPSNNLYVEQSTTNNPLLTAGSNKSGCFVM